MTTGLQFFRGFSLVDITATGVIRDQDLDNSLQRNQQRNWETLLQCIGLRTQPQNIYSLQKFQNHEESRQYHFGDLYTGEHRYGPGHGPQNEKVCMTLPGKPTAGLLQDLEQVPIITGLTETARIHVAHFLSHGTIKNIYITTR
jgi:hypothetical protein